MSNSTKPLYVKEIESGIRFQKTKKFNPEQRLDGKQLRLTFADVNDLTQRPFGNLFTSLHLPISNSQKQEYRSMFTGTALAPLANVSKVVVIDIPKDAYGEMVDGKSIELTLPVTAGAGTGTSTVTCHSTFFGFNPDLNTQLSDQNILSSVFGVEPTSENEFNTNIAYLFSNEIRRPLDSYASSVIDPYVNLTVPGNSSVVHNFDTPWTAGPTYNSTFEVSLQDIDYEFNTGTTANPIYFPFDSIIEPNSRTNNGSFRVRVNVAGVRITNTNNSAQNVIIATQRYTPQSTSNWSKWDITNKFPYTQFATGKRYARLTDFADSLLIDYPVGIAYLDKGIIILTDPLLVNNIDVSLLYADANGTVANGTPYAGLPTEYTAAYFPDITKASLSLKSVNTEYIQSYTCLALQDEFYDTDNPTFRLAYPQGNTENENVYITEVGLYNAGGELIAIAKTSKPVAKNKINVAVFRLSIKI
jgi:hypothetical protein